MNSVVLAIIALLDYLEPRLAEWRKKGEISQDDQLNLKNRMETFRNGTAFSGPEWDVQQDTTLTMPSSGARQVNPADAPQGTEPSNKRSGEGESLVTGGGTPPPAPAVAAPSPGTSNPQPPAHEPTHEPAAEKEHKEKKE